MIVHFLTLFIVIRIDFLEVFQRQNPNHRGARTNFPEITFRLTYAIKACHIYLWETHDQNERRLPEEKTLTMKNCQPTGRGTD